jgi:hypothetical protein
MGGNTRGGKTYPNVWASGPDEYKHKFYRAFAQQRNQAQWRGETWTMSFEEWFDTWGNDIERRGRGSGDLAMTRKDASQPWCVDNVDIITRKEHLQRCGIIRAEQNKQYKEHYNGN